MQASNKSRISISKVKMIKLCWHLQHLTTNFNTSGSDRRGLVDAQLGFDSFPDQASSCFPCADHKTKKLTSSVQLCCRIALVHSLFRNEFSAGSPIFTFTKLSRQCFNCHTFATAQPLIKSSASGVHEGYSLFFNWLHENSIPKIGCDYFWPGLIDLGNNTLPKLASWKLIKV
jgi:hypothetical protein